MGKNAYKAVWGVGRWVNSTDCHIRESSLSPTWSSVIEQLFNIAFSSSLGIKKYTLRLGMKEYISCLIAFQIPEQAIKNTTI